LVDALLRVPGADPVLPGPALTEVIATAHRRRNSSTAAELVNALTVVGMRVEHPVDSDLHRAAELIELSLANPGSRRVTGEPLTLSLGQALILAVTERLGLQIVTKDQYWTQFAAAGHTSARILMI
jgi:PIN domain nuclease of toxin-antitoxin system